MQTHGRLLGSQMATGHIFIVFDDFRVKYIGEQHADHFIESIRKYYPVDVDWTG